MHSEAVNVLFPFDGRTLGGSHISTTALIKALDPLRYRARVVLNCGDGPLADYLRGQGVSFDVLALPVLLNSKADLAPRNWPAIRRMLGEMQHYLRLHRTGIVQTNEKLMRTMWALPARMSGVKFFHFQRGPLKEMDLEKRLTFFLAHHVAGISRYVVDTFPGFVARKSSFIDAPYDTSAPVPDKKAARQALRLRVDTPDGVPLIGMAANLQPRKRPLFFVEIARQWFEAGFGDARFLLIGRAYEGMEGAFAAAVRASGLEERVAFLGFDPDPMLFLAGCDVSVAPAIDEASGRTLIESMLAGTPVVASRDGGHVEYIEDGVSGFLCDKDRPDLFAEKIFALCGDSALSCDIVTNALDMARGRFSLSLHADRVMAVYDKMLFQDASASSNR